jgi:hypothetical protein
LFVVTIRLGRWLIRRSPKSSRLLDSSREALCALAAPSTADDGTVCGDGDGDEGPSRSGSFDMLKSLRPLLREFLPDVLNLVTRTPMPSVSMP